MTDLGDEVFVKFPCFPSVEGYDASGLCKKGMPEGAEEFPKAHQDAIQAVTDACGFSFLKSRTWAAPVHAVTPEVGMYWAIRMDWEGWCLLLKGCQLHQSKGEVLRPAAFCHDHCCFRSRPLQA